MPREVKPETVIRNLKRELKDAYRWKDETHYARKERDDFRVRATRAEQEAKEWKRRFDVLLDKVRPLSLPEGEEEP